MGGYTDRQTDRQTYKCTEVVRNGKMNRQTGRKQKEEVVDNVKKVIIVINILLYQ